VHSRSAVLLPLKTVLGELIPDKQYISILYYFKSFKKSTKISDMMTTNFPSKLEVSCFFFQKKAVLLEADWLAIMVASTLLFLFMVFGCDSSNINSSSSD
jgi:hypothetical protein